MNSGQTEIEKLKRENAVMLAMIAAKINEKEHLPNLNSAEFVRQLGRFISGPEFRPLLVRFSEVKEIMRKASATALETQIRVGRTASG